MARLTWKFENEQKRACAVSCQGRYLLRGKADGTWFGQFIRSPSAKETDSYAVGFLPKLFENMAEAVKACQEHADRISRRSGRLSTV